MSKVKSLIKKIAPIALPLAGAYYGPALFGSTIAAGAPAAAGASALGVSGATGGLLGTGLSTATSGALGGALGGGLGGLASGKGLGGALQGAALGGLGGYTSGGGFSDVLGGTSIGRALGDSAFINPAGTASSVTPSAISGSLIGGGASAFGGSNTLSNILSAGLGTSANDDAEDALLRAQNKALGAIKPFENTSFTPQDLANDPGYQFQLQQGEQALARNQAARGNYFSGEALKAAQDYGQGLAGTAFDAANSRYNQNRAFNYGVATDQAGVYGNQGNIQANSGINNSNLLSGALSGILGGNGISNTGQPLNRTPIGYDPRTGQPIYG